MIPRRGETIQLWCRSPNLGNMACSAKADLPNGNDLMRMFDITAKSIIVTDPDFFASGRMNPS